MKEDKKKLKEIKREERYKTKLLKLRKKYGIRDINEWVEKYPNTVTRLAYDVYIEEERDIAWRQTGVYVIFSIALVLLVVSFFAPMFLISTIVFLFTSCDTQTNVRIDRLEQRQWREMVYNMYRSEKETKDETNES